MESAIRTAEAEGGLASDGGEPLPARDDDVAVDRAVSSLARLKARADGACPGILLGSYRGRHPGERRRKENEPMLPGRRTHTTLPTSDLDRSRGFYEGVLGFTPADVSPGGVTYETGDGTTFLVFPSSGRAAGTHTQMGFTVPDIEAEVRELKERGVTFESYDMAGFDPGLSIASLPGLRTAWFKDPDGNLLGIVQRMN